MEIFTLLTMLCQVEETIKITMAWIFIVFLTLIFCCCYSVTKLCSALCDPLWTAACQASLSFSISWSLPKLKFIESCYLILCHLLLLLPSIFPTVRVFSSESALRIRWPKYWSFSFSIIPSNEYSGLISFRIDQFVLLAVQGAHRSLLQYHYPKISIL